MADKMSSSGSMTATTPASERELEVREIAYFLWEQEGRPHGRDQAHYFRAEQMLRERRADQPTMTPRVEGRPGLTADHANGTSTPHRRGRSPLS